MSGPSNGRKRKGSTYKPLYRPNKFRHLALSDQESSSSSTSEAEQPLSHRMHSPIDESDEVKLPEELLRTFYKTPGALLISGHVSWDLVGKKESNKTRRTHPDLYTFHRFTDRKYRLVVSGCTSGHSILISESGQTYTFGRNTHGQLGLGDFETRNVPELVQCLDGLNIIHAAVGKHHSVFVSDTGTVYTCGDNRSGQCGVGNSPRQLLRPTRIKYSGTPVVKVGAGSEFTMILDCNGRLYSFGLPEFGQLGHNREGKYFAGASKMTFQCQETPKHITNYIEKVKNGVMKNIVGVEIVDFSCGANHTVAIDSQKRAYSWGFGGYGRLGHAIPTDEKMPRLIKYFDTQSCGIRSVHCGGTYSLAINEHGILHLFGQTKRTGEANMYPKPVPDLHGWNIKCVGTSITSVMMAADDTLIAWGASPTHGELGIGPTIKSTTTPREVPGMDGLCITQITMGFSHTLLLCDDTTDEVKEKLANIPFFNP